MTETDFIKPEEHQKFLGKSFINRQNEVVLRIGRKEWTRTELVQRIGVGNIAAAGKLSTVLRKAKCGSVEQLYAIDPRELALIRGLGETTVWVAMAILHTEGFDAGWWYAQALGAQQRTVTFRTMKLTRRRRGR